MTRTTIIALSHNALRLSEELNKGNRFIDPAVVAEWEAAYAHPACTANSAKRLHVALDNLK